MYLYPVWIRLWHTINALLVLILILTGISMQYTDKADDYILVVGFARAVKWHNIAAVLLTFNYIFFVLGNLLTENGKYYRSNEKYSGSALVKQFRYYAFGIFSGEKPPFPVTTERKFNPLQKLTYVLTMYVAFPLLIITGFGLLFPELVLERFFGVSGMIITDIMHITIGFLISVFLVIHIYTCTLGSRPASLFKSMISGFHESGGS